MLERNYAEKRGFIRMKVDTPAQIHVEQNGEITHGICHDLSGGGMLLTLDQELPVASELLVTLTTGSGSSVAMQARCTIARAQPAADDKCLLGVEIQEILGDNSDSAIEQAYN